MECEYCIRPIKRDANTVTTMTGCVYHEACYEHARINAMAGRYSGRTHVHICNGDCGPLADCGDPRDTSLDVARLALDGALR